MVTLIFHVIVSLTALWKICGLINRCYVTSVNYCGGTLGGWGGGGGGGWWLLTKKQSGK